MIFVNGCTQLKVAIMLTLIPKFEGIESCRGGDVFHDVFDDGVALGGAGRPAVRVGRRVGHHRVRYDLPFPSPAVDSILSENTIYP